MFYGWHEIDFYLDEYWNLSLVIHSCACFPTTKFPHKEFHHYRTSYLISELEHCNKYNIYSYITLIAFFIANNDMFLTIMHIHIYIDIGIYIYIYVDYLDANLWRRNFRVTCVLAPFLQRMPVFVVIGAIPQLPRFALYWYKWFFPYKS